MFSSTDLALDIASWATDKKASEVLILEIGKVSHITDYFVIMHATNRVLTSALADAIGEEVEKKYKLHVPHKEGQQQGDWLLLDYGSVVVHIFLEETRRFYDLERLWIDAPLVEQLNQ
jgi:ribosome-associated protein